MTAAPSVEEAQAPEGALRPNLAVLLGATVAVALTSAASLPWPAAAASTVLGGLMAAGADVDARTHLLPDAVTLGAAACGVVAACLLDAHAPLYAGAIAVVRAIGTALALASIRACYARLRGREGLGFGDVKLGLGIGAWLPVEAIPFCFTLAAAAALAAVALAWLRGRAVGGTEEIPFGAFLCPALWLTFYATALPA